VSESLEDIRKLSSVNAVTNPSAQLAAETDTVHVVNAIHYLTLAVLNLAETLWEKP